MLIKYCRNGQLGQGNILHLGDEPNEMGDNLPFVNLGSNQSAKAIVMGYEHTCVLFDNDQIKCFGLNK